MACCGQTGAGGGKCCLCSQGSKKWFPWGAKRKICWRCFEKQKLLIEEREHLNNRVRTLMSGKEFK